MGGGFGDRKCLQMASAGEYSGGALLRISALCRIEPGFEASYAKVAEMFPDVSIIKEECFAQQVCFCVPCAI